MNLLTVEYANFYLELAYTTPDSVMFALSSFFARFNNLQILLIFSFAWDFFHTIWPPIKSNQKPTKKTKAELVVRSLTI